MNLKCILKRKYPTLIAIVLALAIAALLTMSGCAGRDSSAEGGKQKIVATTTMLHDLACAIGGAHVEVTALMGPGVDPHLYQASAGDVAKMQQADVVIYNGLHLEGKMGDIFAALQGHTVICIEDGLDASRLLASEENPDIYDPHIWFDVSLWKDAAKHVAAGLKDADPEHAQAYQSNLDAYLTALEELEEYIKDRVNELPENQRVLITAHDAFRYFGSAYEFTVKGLQGISTDAEAGTADVSNLAGFIAEHQIKAIFVESSVPPKNIEALQAAVKSRGFEVAIGGELYSDSLGDQASGHDTYILTFRANIDTIVDALKG